MSGPGVVRMLGRVGYADAWERMRAFTAARAADTPDEIWLVEHPPVYTLGQAGRREHLLRATDIPVVHSDRGGQVTYHGPGQVVAYVLFDLRRAGIYVKDYVNRLEQALIDTLAALGVAGARRKSGAPGVYLPWPAPDGDLAKIAALGIKVSKGCAYHGVALNVAMDLAPFTWINPCGYEGLRTVDLAEIGVDADLEAVGALLAAALLAQLDAPRTAGGSRPAAVDLADSA